MGKATAPPVRHDWTDYEGYVWLIGCVLALALFAVVIIEVSRNVEVKNARKAEAQAREVEAMAAACEELTDPDDVIRCLEAI